MADVTVENIRADGDGTPVTDDRGWQHYLYRFDVRVGMSIVFGDAEYRQGMAHDVAPTPADILETLALDFDSVQGYGDWLDWAEDLGMLEDAASARGAREMFRVTRQRIALIEENGGSLPTPAD